MIKKKLKRPTKSQKRVMAGLAVAMGVMTACGYQIIPETSATTALYNDLSGGFQTFNEQENGVVGNVIDMSVSPESDFMVYLKDDGTAWYRGNNAFGESGQGDATTKYATPVQIKFDKKFQRVLTTRENVFLVGEDGNVYAMGNNNCGQCGVNDSVNKTIYKPTLMQTVKNIVQVKSGGNMVILVDINGNAYRTGVIHSSSYNYSGQWRGDNDFAYTPRTVGSNVKKVAISGSQAIFLHTDNSVWGYGETPIRDYWSGSAIIQAVEGKTSVANVIDVVATTTGYYYLKSDGSVAYADYYSAIATNATAGAYGTFTNATKIALNGATPIIVCADNSIYEGTTLSTGMTEQVKEIQGGPLGVYLLTVDGNLYGKGNNLGTFGNSGTGASSTWIKILANVKDAYMSNAGFMYTLLKDGTIKSTGSGSSQAITINASKPLDETALLTKGTRYVLNSIDSDLTEFTDLGSNSAYLYGYSKYTSTLLGYSAEGATIESKFTDDNSVANRRVFPSGEVVTTATDGSLRYYASLTTTVGTVLTINSSDVKSMELGYLGDACDLPVILFRKTDDSIYYWDKLSASLKALAPAGSIVDTIAYKTKNATMGTYYFVKSTGAIGYYTTAKVFTSIGINKGDISEIVPPTSANNEMFLMKSGVLKYMAANVAKDVALPSGLTISSALSNRFYQMSDGSVYYTYNNLLYPTGYKASDIKDVCNDVLWISNADGDMLKRANGTTLSDVATSMDFAKSLIKFDNNNEYLLNTDGSTFGIGNLVSSSDLLDSNINYSDVVGFISNNNSSPSAKLLIMKDGTVYTNPAKWTKSTNIALDSTALTKLTDTSSSISFTKVEYSVTFKGKDGSTISTVKVESGKNVIAPTPPTVVGYDFTGWDSVLTGIKANTVITAQYKISDATAPTVNLSPSITSGWTNGNVTINANATDSESGVKSITLPDGTAVNGASASYSATQNGTYSFKATDNAGNIGTNSIVIGDGGAVKIDKDGPSITLTPNTTNKVTNSDVVVTVKAVDSLSGVKNITLPDGTIVNGATSSFTATQNGTYTVKSLDNAGNVSTQSILIGAGGVTSIDRTAPTINVNYDRTNGWTNKDILATVTVTDSESGVAKIIMPDGTEVAGNTGTFPIAKNGTYTVKAVDNAGNVATKNVVIDGTSLGIDKNAPTLDVTSSVLNGWTKDTITLSAKASDAESGIHFITLPDGSVVNSSIATFKVNADGIYNFKATDNAGNETTKQVIIGENGAVRIDNVSPTLKLSIDSTTWTDDDVTINAVATDTGSGVKAITLPDGSQVNSSTASYNAVGNGVYKFSVVDNVGNMVEDTIEITTIDKSKPNAPDLSGIATGDQDKWRNTDYFPNVKMGTATASGIKEIQYQIVNKTTGGVIKDWSKFTAGTTGITNQGISTVNFRTVSNTGVISDSVGITVKIDKTLPTISATCDNSQWSSEGTYITVKANDALSGIQSVLLPNGNTITLTDSTFLALDNGTYKFIVTDNAGNTAESSVTVTNVDKTMPSMPVITNAQSDDDTGWLHTDYIPNITTDSSTSSGLKEVQYQLVDKTTGNVVQGWTKYENGITKVSREGLTVMNLRAVSNSGVASKVAVTNVRIDKTNPTGSVTATTPSNSLAPYLNFKVTANDALSGVKSVSIDGNNFDYANNNIIMTQAVDKTVTVYDRAGNKVEVLISANQAVNKNKDDIIAKIQDVINRWHPTNGSKPEDLQKLVTAVIGTTYNTTVVPWNLTPAQEETKGKVTGDVVVKDAEGNTITVSFDKEIAALWQTVESAKSRLEANIGDLVATNNTEKPDLISQIMKYVTNPNITVDIENFFKEKATIHASGKITGVAVFKDTDGNSASVNLDLVIKKIVQTLEDAKAIITANLGNIKVDNNTVEQTIIDQVNPYIDTETLTVSIKNFKKELATEDATGKVLCTIVVTNKEGKFVEIPFEGKIAQLEQSIDGALKAIQAHLSEVKPTNTTTASDVIKILEKYITNQHLHLTIPDFKLDKATTTDLGKIVGSLTVTDDRDQKNKSVPMDIAIEKLPVVKEDPGYVVKPVEVPVVTPTVKEVIADVADGNFVEAVAEIKELPKTDGIAIASGLGSLMTLALGGAYGVVRRFKKK